MIRLPFAPLEEEIARRLQYRPSDVELMTVLRIGSEATVYRHRRSGLTVWTADRYAVSLSLHPIDIWGVKEWLETIDGY